MIQVLHRAMDILEIVSAHPSGYTAIQLAQQLRLNRATCTNIIRTLMKRDYLLKIHGSRNYILGPRAFGLSRRRYFLNDMVVLAKDRIDQLSREQGHPAVLTAMCQYRCYSIYNARPELGMPADEEALYVSDISLKASGRLLYAFMTPDKRKIFFEENPESSKGWRKLKGIRAELARIRQSCFAVVENDHRLTGLAVPLFSGDCVVAALGMYMPRSECPKTKQKAFITAMRKMAEAITLNFTAHRVQCQ